MRKYVPSYSGTLRSHGLTLPHCISECSGIRIFGKRRCTVWPRPTRRLLTLDFRRLQSYGKRP